jgi:hypothetical protein
MKLRVKPEDIPAVLIIRISSSPSSLSVGAPLQGDREDMDG